MGLLILNSGFGFWVRFELDCVSLEGVSYHGNTSNSRVCGPIYPYSRCSLVNVVRD